MRLAWQDDAEDDDYEDDDYEQELQDDDDDGEPPAPDRTLRRSAPDFEIRSAALGPTEEEMEQEALVEMGVVEQAEPAVADGTGTEIGEEEMQDWSGGEDGKEEDAAEQLVGAEVADAPEEDFCSSGSGIESVSDGVDELGPPPGGDAEDELAAGVGLSEHERNLEGAVQALKRTFATTKALGKVTASRVITLSEQARREQPGELLAASTSDDGLLTFATKLVADSESIERPRDSRLRAEILKQRDDKQRDDKPAPELRTFSRRKRAPGRASEASSEAVAECAEASSTGSAPAVFTNDNTMDVDEGDHALDAAKQVKEGDHLLTKYTSGTKYWVVVDKIVSSTATITAAASWCDGSGTTTIRLWQQSGKPDWYEKPASRPSLATASRLLSCFFDQAASGCLSTGNHGATPFETRREFELAWDREMKDDPCEDASESARQEYERRFKQKVAEFEQAAEREGASLQPDYRSRIRRQMQDPSVIWMQRHPEFAKRVAESAESLVGDLWSAARQQYPPAGCILAEKMTWPVRTDSFKEFTPFHYLLGRDALRPPTSESLLPSQKWIDALPHENSVFAGAINSSIPRAGDLVTVRKKNVASEAATSSEFGYIVLAAISPFDMNQVDLGSSDSSAVAAWMECCLDLDQYCLFVQRFALKGHGTSKEIQLIDHRNMTLTAGELQPEILQYGLRSEEWHTISVRSSSELKPLLGEAVLQRLSQGMREHPIFSALFADDVQEMQGALSGAVFDWLRSPELFAQRIGGTEAMVKHIVGSGLQTASAVRLHPPLTPHAPHTPHAPACAARIACAAGHFEANCCSSEADSEGD